MMRASFAAAVLSIALLVASCSDDDPVAPPQYVERPNESASIDWEDCGYDSECGFVAVPLDYADPDGETIDIAISRRTALSDDEWAGVLLVNWGGPGAPGLDAAIDAEYAFPREILQHFDVIGFDPRGTGESSPVRCGTEDSREFPSDLTPSDDEERELLVNNARIFARACLAQSRALVPHVNTINTARDMDRIREALGVERINYFGQSYGTLLGAQYAELYPDHVRAMVLDSAIDPSLDFDQYVEDAALALERALNAFLDDCQIHRSCDFYSGGSPHQAYDELIRKLEDDTLEAVLYDDDTLDVNQADAHSAAVMSLYSEGSRAQLSLALVEAQRDGDGSLLLDLAYGYASEEDSGAVSGAQEAIFCGDWIAPRSEERFHELYEQIEPAAPRIGAMAAYWDLACAFLPEPGEPLRGPFRAEGAPPVLVVGSKGDAATPYSWSEALADQLNSASLLTYDGIDHAVVFTTVSQCIDDAALRYLVDLTLPVRGTTCG